MMADLVCLVATMPRGISSPVHMAGITRLHNQESELTRAFVVFERSRPEQASFMSRASTMSNVSWRGSGQYHLAGASTK